MTDHSGNGCHPVTLVDRLGKDRIGAVLLILIGVGILAGLRQEP